MIDELTANGFALMPGIISRAQVDSLRATLGDAPRAGRRGMLAEPAVAAMAHSDQLLALVRSHLLVSSLPPPFIPAPPRPVRAISFDKSPSANWLVAWHQDLTIVASERRDAPGFGPWSVKVGVPHVQPPIELLEHMLTVRLHLDAANESNGALRILAGTHRHGRLTAEQIEAFRQSIPEAVCHAAEGDALLMRPLVLHASSRATAPTRRRVLHIEYAACELPYGLAWHLST